MNPGYSYADAGRPRAFSFEGQPGAVQQAPVSPRFYPSNQPTYRPTYGAPGAYPQTAYPGYTTAPGPAYTQAGPYGGPAFPGPGPMVVGPGPVGSVGSPNNSTVCCPLPGPQENPEASQSAHAFQSNLPAGECEGLVRRDVEYQTEWVAVPVQKPVVYETYQRVVEIPTQHLVSVQNMPGQVPARQCDTTTASPIVVGQTFGAPPPVAYNTGAPLALGAPPATYQTAGAPISYQTGGPISYQAGAPISYQPGAPVPYQPGAPVSYQPGAPVAYGAPVYGGYPPAHSGAMSPVPWSGGAPVMGGPGLGPVRTFSL